MGQLVRGPREIGPTMCVLPGAAKHTDITFPGRHHSPIPFPAIICQSVWSSVDDLDLRTHSQSGSENVFICLLVPGRFVGPFLIMLPPL